MRGGVHSTNAALVDAVRHNIWGNRTIVAFVRELGLTDEQLATSGVGTFGDILATLSHVVSSDVKYLRRLLPEVPSWAQRIDDTDLDGLASIVDRTEALWEQLLSEPIDVERVIVVDGGANEVHAGVYIAQALSHGTLHREQVCSTLTGLGIEPPDLQAWEYAWAVRRLRSRTAD